MAGTSRWRPGSLSFDHLRGMLAESPIPGPALVKDGVEAGGERQPGVAAYRVKPLPVHWRQPYVGGYSLHGVTSQATTYHRHIVADITG
jgi:hypothetical protein